MNRFKKGDLVVYIPRHAHIGHPDCEKGVVSSVGTHYVFVRYYHGGHLDVTAKATQVERLVHQEVVNSQ